MALELDLRRLDGMLEELSREWDLFGPVEQETAAGTVVDWGPVEGWSGLKLEVMPKSSIKRFLFPQPEPLFRFEADGQGGYEVTAHAGARPRMVLGVRPCDARSICLNMLPYREDPYFRHRWASTVVVGIACEEPCPTCFCKEVGGGPHSTQGMDARIVAEGQGLRLELFTERAASLLGGGGAVDEAPESEEGPVPLLERLKGAGLSRLYGAPIWGELAQACLNCGICTFLCPTCYCFDIQDERLGSRGRRIRYWDSCMFPLFTQHASGHNPRPTKLHRVRNRFLHKLKYFPDRFGPFSCVGCGRCIRECPVGIDIRQVAAALAEIGMEERREGP